jgi:hypothetical protein
MQLPAAACETDRRFPSGAWTGFFQQSWLPGRHPTDLTITFRDGRMWGEGSDWVGPYTVDGTYDVADGNCRWTKQYLGKHAVSYLGTAEGTGVWGAWEIRAFAGLYRDRGLFHFWPRGSEPGEEADRTYAARRPSFPWVWAAVLLAALAAAAALLVAWGGFDSI